MAGQYLVSVGQTIVRSTNSAGLAVKSTPVSCEPESGMLDLSALVFHDLYFM